MAYDRKRWNSVPARRVVRALRVTASRCTQCGCGVGGVTQDVLSSAIDRSVSHYCSFENDYTSVTLDEKQYRKVLLRLGVTVRQFEQLLDDAELADEVDSIGRSYGDVFGQVGTFRRRQLKKVQAITG